MASGTPGRKEEMNKIVNSVIPRDVEYKSKINFSEPKTLAKFHKKWNKKFSDQAILGKTKLFMIAELGHGDEEKGERLLQHGIKTNQILVKGGFYFQKQMHFHNMEGNDDVETLHLDEQIQILRCTKRKQITK